ncbi:MAG TPA: hypothetical protein VK858_15965 [Longimicrobiales bacterium]|nr:hypothetical protein [Longimicrobiales bacterium]
MIIDRIQTHASAALAAAALLCVAPGLLQAQDTDRRWLPFTGCWEVVGDQETSDVVCVQPGTTAVEVRLVHGADDLPDQIIRADGQPRVVSQNGCEGTESARFSANGARVYTEGEYLCEDGVRQLSTGVITMIAPDEWVDIRSLEMDGEQVAWVQRYVQGTPQALRADEAGAAVTPQVSLARRLAARTPQVDDLLDVAANVDAEVARTWVATVGQPFELDGDALLALSEAGVDDDVIDVAVAVSHPQYFRVGAEGALAARDRSAERTAYGAGGVGYGYAGCYSRRAYFTPWGGAYSCAGLYGYGWGYSPYSSFYGSPYWGYGGYYGGYWGGPTIIVVDREDGSGSGGRAVAGRGYQGPRSNGPSGSSWTPPRSGGSAGGASSGGYSGGSRGGATTRSGGTRKAKPRGGGGI